MIVRKKKIRVQSNLFFVLIFFPWKPTQPPFLVPVHPLKKTKNTYPQISFNKICFFIILLAFKIFDLVELFSKLHTLLEKLWLIEMWHFWRNMKQQKLKLKDSNIKKNTGSKILLSNNNLQKNQTKKNK